MGSLLKFFTAMLLTALLAFAGSLLLPWWIIAIVSFFVALILPLKPWLNFLAGFGALFLLWGGIAMIINIQNRAALASKLAVVLPLGGSAGALVFVTALVAALVAGMAALSGRYLYGITSSPD